MKWRSLISWKELKWEIKEWSEVKGRDMKCNEMEKIENYVMKWNKLKGMEWNEVH